MFAFLKRYHVDGVEKKKILQFIRFSKNEVSSSTSVVTKLFYILALNYRVDKQKQYLSFFSNVKNVASPRLLQLWKLNVNVLVNICNYLMKKKTTREELLRVIYNSDIGEQRSFDCVIQENELARAKNCMVLNRSSKSKNSSDSPIEKGCTDAKYLKNLKIVLIPGKQDQNRKCVPEDIYVPLKNIYSSTDGFMTFFWGPLFWYFLETIALFVFCNNYNSKIKAQTLQAFFESVRFVLPCCHCRDNYVQNSRDAGIEDLNNFENALTTSLFVFNLHKIVNKCLKKKMYNNFTFNDMLDKHKLFIKKGVCITYQMKSEV